MVKIKCVLISVCLFGLVGSIKSNIPIVAEDLDIEVYAYFNFIDSITEERGTNNE